MMNTKRSSSGACDILLRVANYCLVQLMVVLTNLNFPIIVVVDITRLFQGFFCCVGTLYNEYCFKRNFLFF